MTDTEIVWFENASDWEQWLDANHDKSPGAWLKIAKKASDKVSVSNSDALDIALCFGWIDSQRQKLDDDFYVQRYTPRRKNSKWSQVNVEKAEALIGAGKMRDAGFREIEAAKADGRWEAAYLPQSKAPVPDDLRQALDANPAASAFFDTLRRANRYAIIYRVTTAKKPETRQKRIEQYVKMLAEGKMGND
ncbi:MAG: YdeI/OmpD-associated family protein [Chloroflexi bacterium]|nr:YdeI/OmpD-associated family protein [Chloroflexota bacterium]